jgi:hypothetical protein
MRSHHSPRHTLPSSSGLVAVEWALQATWRVVDRPEDGGRQSAIPSKPEKPLTPRTPARHGLRGM